MVDPNGRSNHDSAVPKAKTPGHITLKPAFEAGLAALDGKPRSPRAECEELGDLRESERQWRRVLEGREKLGAEHADTRRGRETRPAVLGIS